MSWMRIGTASTRGMMSSMVAASLYTGITTDSRGSRRTSAPRRVNGPLPNHLFSYE